jgi:hypothetical protein
MNFADSDQAIHRSVEKALEIRTIGAGADMSMDGRTDSSSTQ